MSSRPVYRMCAQWRHLVNTYWFISLVQLFAAAKHRVWQLLACAKPCCYLACVPVFVVLSCVAACMYVLPCSSVQLSCCNKGRLLLLLIII